MLPLALAIYLCQLCLSFHKTGVSPSEDPEVEFTELPPVEALTDLDKFGEELAANDVDNDIGEGMVDVDVDTTPTQEVNIYMPDLAPSVTGIVHMSY